MGYRRQKVKQNKLKPYFECFCKKIENRIMLILDRIMLTLSLQNIFVLRYCFMNLINITSLEYKNKRYIYSRKIPLENSKIFLCFDCKLYTCNSFTLKGYICIQSIQPFF